eukprot:scaffold127572_cov48-Cyclotella_meneghiniana.AAC.1
MHCAIHQCPFPCVLNIQTIVHVREDEPTPSNTAGRMSPPLRCHSETCTIPKIQCTAIPQCPFPC